MFLKILDFISINGTKLSYGIEGSGIPCLVIGSAIYYPRTFSQELRQHFKFIFADTRGFVPTDTPIDLEKITVDTFSDDVEQIRKALDIPKICVLGHSIHGMLALEYARKYPQNTSHVIVIGSPINGSRKNLKASRQYWASNASEERKDIYNRMMDSHRMEELSDLTPGDMMKQNYINNAPFYWYDPTYDCSWIWEGVKVNPKITGKLQGVLFKTYDIAKDSNLNNIPIFVAMGKHDYMVPHFQWNAEIEKLTKLSYYLFEKIGHTPQLEEPDEFDKKLIEWIKKHS